VLELDDRPAAELAAVLISREQERVRNLSPEAPWDVHKLRETNDRWPWKRQPLGADDADTVGLHDFGLSIDHKPQRPLHGNHGEGLERCIERQTADDHAALQLLWSFRSFDP
jgi:hypothetical protein